MNIDIIIVIIILPMIVSYIVRKEIVYFMNKNKEKVNYVKFISKDISKEFWWNKVSQQDSAKYNIKCIELSKLRLEYDKLYSNNKSMFNDTMLNKKKITFSCL